MDILLNLGFIQIRWYSFLILSAFIVGYFIVLSEAKKKGIDKEKILDLVFYLIPICIIGARLYYVIFNWSYYSQDLLSIIKIWQGGLAIHGGIISGAVFLIYFSKKNKISFFKLTDIIVPALILGQAIGRWGNFFNQEAYGPATTLSRLKDMNLPNFIISGMKIGNNYYEPTFLYESMFCIFGLLVILLMKKIIKQKEGQTTAQYFIIYGIIRFFVESLRQDSLMVSSLKVAQLVSIVMIVLGIIIYIGKFDKK